MSTPPSPDARRALMRRIRKTDTKPELALRRLAHALGYRFRLHRRDLPGTPDLVFPCRRKVIFVHGCFWHQHDCRLGRKRPSTNTGYWHPKLARNVERDRINRARLTELGWDVLVVWECEIGDSETLSRQISSFLGPVSTAREATHRAAAELPSRS
jgi:DNA mismatch endonuclease (patch repair protein)